MLLGLVIVLTPINLLPPSSNVANAEVAEVVEVAKVAEVYTKAQIVEKIHEYANRYNVPYTKMYNIIACETANTFDPKIQSRVKYNFSSQRRGIVKGARERSFGLSQIHLPDHPNVSEEQAKDPDFALDFTAKHLSRGKHIWSCPS